MRSFTASIATAATPLKLLSLLTALMLQACGGGGGDNQPDATPASQAQTPSHFMLAETRSSVYTNGTAQHSSELRLVDTRTNAVVDTLTLSELPYNQTHALRGQWLASNRQQSTLGQHTTTLLGISQLFYIQNGQLMQRDLSGERLGSPRRISALNICAMDWQLLQLNEAGTDGWLPVSVADPDTGLCDDPTKLTHHLMPVGATASTASAQTIALQADHALFDIPIDAAQKPLGILVLDRSAEKMQMLLLSSQDMRTRLQTISLGANAPLSQGGVIQMLGAVAGDPQQALVQINQSIHKLDWRSGRIVLSAPIMALQGQYPSSVNGDRQHVYVADGCYLHRIDAAGNARLFATLPAEGGEIQGITLTARYAVITQYQPSAFQIGAVTAPGCAASTSTSYSYATALHAVTKSSGTVKQLKPLTTDAGFHVIGHVNDVAYVSSNLSIERIDLNSGASSITAQGVSLLSYYGIGSRQYDGFDFQNLQNQQLMWCELKDKTTGSCSPGDEIVSHVIDTGDNIVLGVMPDLRQQLGLTEDHYVSTYAYLGFDGRWSDAPGVLEFSVYVSAPYNAQTPLSAQMSVPWLVTPGVAGSLREIPGALPELR